MSRLLFPLIAALMLSITPAHAEITQCTNITTLPTVISTQGVYCLKQDLATNMTSGNAITINANNVTLDCNDWKIGGLAAGNTTDTYGIYAGDRMNTTIRNCGIRGFKDGIHIYAYMGSGHLIEDNRLDNNTLTGIFLATDGSSIVRRNRVFDTGGLPDYWNATAIEVHGSGNIITENFINTVYSVGSPLSENSGSARGIYIGNYANEVSNNVITNLMPKGSYWASGIDISGFGVPGVTSIRGNTLINSSTVRGWGIRGDSPKSHCKDNTVHGFDTGIQDCMDVSGNSVSD